MKKGHKHTEEARAKMRGPRVLSAEGRASLSVANKGKKISEETRQRMSESQRGRIVSEETRQKLSACNRGPSPEQAKSISAAHQRKRKERSLQIAPLLAAGLNFAQIAKQIGVASCTVSDICKDFGFKKIPHPPEKSRAARLLGKKRYRQKHPDRVRKQWTDWSAKNREHVARKSREWVAKNRDKRKATSIAHSGKRRATIRLSPAPENKLITSFCEQVKVARSIRCRWCRKPVPKNQREIDHIIPLAKGGAHTLSNLCCACSKCNRRKSAKMPEEFTGQGELRFV